MERWKDWHVALRVLIEALVSGKVGCWRGDCRMVGAVAARKGDGPAAVGGDDGAFGELVLERLPSVPDEETDKGPDKEKTLKISGLQNIRSMHWICMLQTPVLGVVETWESVL